MRPLILYSWEIDLQQFKLYCEILLIDHFFDGSCNLNFVIIICTGVEVIFISNDSHVKTNPSVNLFDDMVDI